MSSLAVPPFLWSDTGDFASPVEYTVPGSGEVQPYTATATFINASGQAILPALRIKSAAGNLLALTFPVGQTIADGTASEVTFVPPFGSAQGSSTSTGTPDAWALVARDTNQAIASGFAQAIAWTSFATSDPTVFATTPNGASGDTGLVVNKPGTCVAMSNTAWQAFFTADNYAIINGSPGLTSGPAYNVPWFDLLANGPSPPNSALKSAAPVGGTYGLTDHHRAVFPDNGSIAQGGFRLDAFQQSGVNRNIQARMAVFFRPLAAGYTVVY